MQALQWAWASACVVMARRLSRAARHADSIPAAVQALYLQGNEIATHTVTHPSYPSAEEIVGCRDWLVNNTGIPAEKMLGFRCASRGRAAVGG